MAIAKANGKIAGPDGAANLLGLNTSTLWSKIRKYNIDPKTLFSCAGPANNAAYSASCLQTSTHVPPVTRSKSASERHTALFGAPAAG